MNRSDHAVFFEFEQDFVEADIRCIPMIVRFKLDACGIKLKLAEWSRMTKEDRAYLAMAPCEQPDDVGCYRSALCELIVRRTGNTPTPIPVAANPPWSQTAEIPYPIRERVREMSVSLSLDQWRQLTDLQRFALLKLSYSGHENRNFPIAMKEFGLMC